MPLALLFDGPKFVRAVDAAVLPQTLVVPESFEPDSVVKTAHYVRFRIAFNDGPELSVYTKRGSRPTIAGIIHAMHDRLAEVSLSRVEATR